MYRKKRASFSYIQISQTASQQVECSGTKAIMLWVGGCVSLRSMYRHVNYCMIIDIFAVDFQSVDPQILFFLT